MSTEAKRIGALIPVRLRSERLPGKALRMLSGRPVIYHLLDRVAACRYIEDVRDVVVCTTQHASDDPLASAVEHYGASVFRGHPDDIIERFANAMEVHDFDAVVQADGDDPLSATEFMDVTMETLLQAQSTSPPAGIVTVSGVPLGCATKSFTREAMRTVLRSYRTNRNDTGFIYFFTRSGLVKHIDIECNQATLQHPHARLTLDYELDLKLFEAVFDALYQTGELFGLADTVTFLRNNPELAALNLSVEDEYWQRTADKVELTYVDDHGIERVITQ
jgi:spore coat polysaccharide biosynthesis protein SpsF